MKITLDQRTMYQTVEYGRVLSSYNDRSCLHVSLAHLFVVVMSMPPTLLLMNGYYIHKIKIMKSTEEH